MEQITLHLTGQAPLLMHRPVLVNALDERTKEIKKYTGKRKKTQEDIEVIMRLEWEAGLYHDPAIGPYLPGVNVETCLRDSGKITKLGTAVTRGVIVPDDKLPLLYDGPRGNGNGVQELWDANYKDYRVVGNQQNAVMRCRPCFKPNSAAWRLEVPLMVEPSIIDPDEVIGIARRAGLMIGLGDYRPRFGRFTVEVA
jgi:hypothetical protein